MEEEEKDKKKIGGPAAVALLRPAMPFLVSLVCFLKPGKEISEIAPHRGRAHPEG